MICNGVFNRFLAGRFCNIKSQYSDVLPASGDFIGRIYAWGIFLAKQQ